MKIGNKLEEVIINGVKYTPESKTKKVQKIGLGITTHNRTEVFRENLSKWRQNAPEGLIIVIVDDGSQTPVEEATHRFETPVGIAKAKNKCIELLDAAGVDEFFLADDDCYPLTKDWAEQYINHPEPHLMGLFKELTKGNKLNDVKTIYEDTQTVAYSGARGYFLYFNRKVIETVGGMDPIYGKWGFEHVDFSNRIFNAGLTSYHYADIPGSPENIIYSMDQHVEINRSTLQKEREANIAFNSELCHTRRNQGYTSFVEYRETKNVVITCLYGTINDPQRPSQRMTLTETETLLESVTGAETVLFTDLDPSQSKANHTIQSETYLNIFYQRHLNALKYLKQHPEVQYVWCVDATDVQMLREPWEWMKPGVLYTGWEEKTLNDPWMKQHHPTQAVQDFLRLNPNLTLLNAGVFGGDRQTVINFLQNLINYWFNREINVFRGKEHNRHELGDMGGFNYVAYTKHSHQIQTGSHVTTVFKKEQTAVNSPAWWKHK